MARAWKRALATIVPIAALATLAGGAPVAAEGQTETYLVVYHREAVPADAASSIADAGGSLVARYDEIGVVVARSDLTTFGTTVLRDRRVQGAAATSAYAVHVDGGQAEDTGDDVSVAAPATDNDSLSGLQWDMRQIQTPEAHAITGGDRSVIVGDLDTGLDFTHPDLAPNYDAANSADCSSGVAQPLLPGNDQNGHGTHTAGTIAAASNGIGIVGVAPNVRIAGIKASNDSGYFFPEMVVCAFMWAGSHGFDVTNNSYFADPWLYNCVNDPEQRAIWTAERRAIRYAMQQGVVVVASEGNFAEDLSHPTQDRTSPDNTTPVTRDITNACRVVPVEVPGVIGVTATGDLSRKSYYSNYGVSTADVAAPGGDALTQITPQAPNGRVLSTYPSSRPCSRVVFDGAAKYCYLQGTSMAAPHVAGLAALIRSVHPDMPPSAVEAVIQRTATPIACPDEATLALYAPFNGTNSQLPQQCQGGETHNSWYGHGEVNALRAVQQ